MNKKLGPLPTWAWALIAGGGIGAILLIRHLKATKTEGEPTPELAAQMAPGVSEAQGGGGSGGGSVGSLESEVAKQSAQAELLRQEINFLTEHPPGAGQSQGILGNGFQEIREAKEGLEQLGLIPAASQTNSTPSSEAKGPSKGVAAFPLQSGRGEYREGTYKGHAAHIYSKPVKNGVGPGRNIIVIGGPGKRTHGVKGSHAPAAVSAPPPPSVVATPAPAAAASLPTATPLKWGPHGWYSDTTYKGKRAHSYTTAFSGGVGPHHNLVIL